MSYDFRQDPYAMHEQARFSYRLPQIIFMALMGFTILFVSSHREHLSYSFDRAGPNDLGNSREHFLAGRTSLDVKHGQYVRMEGLIPTRYRVGEAEEGTVFFTDYFAPIFNIVVRTTVIPEAQPDFSGRQYIGGFPTEFLKLVQTRKVHVENLHVHAAAEGRIFRMDQAPEYLNEMVDYYRRHLDRPIDNAWIILDGMTPASVRYVWWVLMGFILTDIVGFWWVLRARRRLMTAASTLEQIADE
jgi:hypothetical protein